MSSPGQWVVLVLSLVGVAVVAAMATVYDLLRFTDACEDRSDR